MEDEDGTCLLDVLCDPQALNDFLHGTNELSGSAPSLFNTTSPVSPLGDALPPPDTPPPGCVDLSFLEEALLSSPEEGGGGDQEVQGGFQGKEVHVEEVMEEEEEQQQEVKEEEQQEVKEEKEEEQQEVKKEQQQEVKEEKEEEQQQVGAPCDILQQSLQEAEITEQTLTLSSPLLPPPKAVLGDTPAVGPPQALGPPQPSLMAVGPGCPSLRPPSRLLLPGTVFPSPSPENSSVIITKGVSGLLPPSLRTAAPPGLVLQRAPLPIQPKLPVRLVQISPKPPGVTFSSSNILKSAPPRAPPQPLPKPLHLQLLSQGGASFLLQPQGLFQGRNHLLQGHVTITQPGGAAVAPPTGQLNFSPIFTPPSGQLALHQAAVLSGPLQLQPGPPTVFLPGTFTPGGPLGNHITLINSSVLPPDLTSISILNGPPPVLQGLPSAPQGPAPQVVQGPASQQSSVVLGESPPQPALSLSLLSDSQVQVQVQVQDLQRPQIIQTRPESPVPDPQTKVQNQVHVSQALFAQNQVQMKSSVSKPPAQDQVQVSAPQDQVQVSAPQDQVQVSASQDQVQVSAPQDQVQVSASQDQVSASQDQVQVSAPQDQVQVSAPQDQVQVSASQDQVQVSAPQDQLQVSASQDQVQVSASQDQVLDSAFQVQVQASAPEVQVKDLAPQVQVLDSAHQLQVQASAPEDQVLDSGVQVQSPPPRLSECGDVPAVQQQTLKPTAALVLESDSAFPAALVLESDSAFPAALVLESDSAFPLHGAPGPTGGAPTLTNQQTSTKLVPDQQKEDKLSPAQRSQRFQQQLGSDVALVQTSVSGPAFSSLKNAVSRLLPYHSCSGHMITEHHLHQVDQEFDSVSGFLLKRTKDLVNKYRQLLVREAQQSSPSAEMVMLERLFLQAERFTLMDDRRRVKHTDSFMTALSPPSSGPAHLDSSGPAHQGSSGPAHQGSSGPAHQDSSGPAHQDSSGPTHQDSSGPAHQDSSGSSPSPRSSPRGGGSLRLTIKRKLVQHAAGGLQRDHEGQLTKGGGASSQRRLNEANGRSDSKIKDLGPPKLKCLRLEESEAPPTASAPPPAPPLQDELTLSLHLQNAIDSILELQRMQRPPAPPRATHGPPLDHLSILEGHL